MWFSTPMMMKPYLSFIWWVLLTPNFPCWTTYTYPGWTPPPDGSTYIWDINNSADSTTPAWFVKLQKEITVLSTTELLFSMTVDNATDLYIDWVKVFSISWYSWLSYRTYILPEWTHRILFYCENFDDTPTHTWPAWLAVSIKRTSDNIVIEKTDATWTYTTNSLF